MKWWLSICIVLVGMSVSGCNLGIPQATPTVAPTRTPSITPSQIPTLIPSATNTVTSTSLPTIIALQPTVTPTNFPTLTISPTWTTAPTATLTPTTTVNPTATRTNTQTPTVTPSATITSTITPRPTVTPSQTLTATWTLTLTPSITPSATSVPTVTPLPTIGASSTPTPTETPIITPFPSPTNPPTLTPLPTLTSTPTAGFVPLGERPSTADTLTVTPTVATVAPNTTIEFLPPTLPAATADILLTSFVALTPLAAPTMETAPSAIIVPSALPQPVVNDTIAFLLTTNNGFTGEVVPMPGGTFTLARSPLNPNHVVLVDARRLMYVFTDFAGGQGGRISGSPFSEPEPQFADNNQARVAQVAYSPDARYVAFLVDTDSDATGDNDSSNDGIWVLPVDPVSGMAIGGTFILLRDCPPGCTIVNRPDAPYQYRSLRFEWNAAGDMLLVELDLPEEGRRGVAVLYPAIGPASAETRAPVLRYDYASWTANGTRLVVSGRAPDGQIVIGTVAPDGSSPSLQAISSFGLVWAQNAVETYNGQLLFLGNSTGKDNPIRLYNASGIALTTDIGTTAPVRVSWSPDRRAVLVVTLENGVQQYYVAQVNSGEVQRISEQTGGALAVEWVGN